jgi:hypothetical protein
MHGSHMGHLHSSIHRREITRFEDRHSKRQGKSDISDDQLARRLSNAMKDELAESMAACTRRSPGGISGDVFFWKTWDES